MSSEETATTSEKQSPEVKHESKASEEEVEQTPLVGFKDFLKIDLRVAQILEAERVEKSEKLVKLQISLGEKLGKRQIVAGIAKHYSAEELVGRKIVVVANLKPAKLMGIASEGMLLAASDDESLSLLSPGTGIEAGTRVG